MTDPMPLTAFDAIAVTVVILSAIMALSRGFMRELATLGAFVAAIAAAYYVRAALHDEAVAILPANSPSWTADLILVLVAFVLVYVAVAWLGARLSRNIQGFDAVGMIDRVAGLGFGIVRGLVAMVFAVLLIKLALPADRIPGWIIDARLYPALATAAEAVQTGAPQIAGQAGAALPNTR